MDNKEEKYRVPSLEKGLSILDCLSRNNKGMTLQEIKEELELSQTTGLSYHEHDDGVWNF